MRKRYIKAKQEAAFKKGFEQIARRALKDEVGTLHIHRIYTPRYEDTKIGLVVANRLYISDAQHSDVNKKMSGTDYLKLEELPF